MHIDDRPVQGFGPEQLDMNKVRYFFEELYGIDLNACVEDEQKKNLVNACILACTDTELCATITGLLFLETASINLCRRLNVSFPGPGYSSSPMKTTVLKIL